MHPHSGYKQDVDRTHVPLVSLKNQYIIYSKGLRSPAHDSCLFNCAESHVLLTRHTCQVPPLIALQRVVRRQVTCKHTSRGPQGGHLWGYRFRTCGCLWLLLWVVLVFFLFSQWSSLAHALVKKKVSPFGCRFRRLKKNMRANTLKATVRQ